MIKPEYCYKKIGESEVIVPYFETNWQSLHYEDYYGFNVCFLAMELALQEPLLAKINETHKIKYSGIIRLDADRCYKWHQDAVRGVSINMLLRHKDSFVMFGNSSKDSEDQFDIIRMEYEIGSFYLFNTQAMHTVVNFEEPRYLFTIEFEKDKESLTYNEILNTL